MTATTKKVNKMQ